MTENQPSERFIPYRKSELVEMLCQEGGLKDTEQELFLTFSRLLESIYHFEFHEKLENLKDNYHPLNPDADTLSKREYSPEKIRESEENLLRQLEEILNSANYEPVTETDMAFAMERKSFFKINLMVDFEDFEKHLIFRRGSGTETVEVRKWFFSKEKIVVPVYDRVVMLIKFKDADWFRAKKRADLKFRPGAMIFKLFKDIPKGDMEMLFPNTQVRMRLGDIIIMGGGALGGGAAVLLKAGSGLLALGTVLWVIIRSFVASGGRMPHLGPAEISGMVGGASALAAVTAFLVKQWNSYKNRKIRFMKTLGDSLYFKNLDNNAGVFFRLIDDAEEEECKEAVLAYFFLLSAKRGLTETDLDAAVEGWFRERHGTVIDFEIADALRKLKELSLVNDAGKTADGKIVWEAVRLKAACQRLDWIWDDFFVMH